MKTMILAAATALTLSAGVALANESGGYGGPTQFTQLPGVLAQAPVQNQASAVAQGGQVHVYATQSKQTEVSPFQPGYNNG
jgi:hypothetical protein